MNACWIGVASIIKLLVLYIIDTLYYHVYLVRPIQKYDWFTYLNICKLPRKIMILYLIWFLIWLLCESVNFYQNACAAISAYFHDWSSCRQQYLYFAISYLPILSLIECVTLPMHLQTHNVYIHTSNDISKSMQCNFW